VTYGAAISSYMPPHSAAHAMAIILIKLEAPIASKKLTSVFCRTKVAHHTIITAQRQIIHKFIYSDCNLVGVDQSRTGPGSLSDA
jgi:hypothetical protein